MIKVIALVYYLAPILAVGSVVALIIVRGIEKREEAAKEQHERRRKEHAEDCYRAGAAVRLERWRRKVNHWKSNKLQDALMAGAKRIDEMRAK